MSEYVIIGNGAAAAGCIEGIRSVDRKTPITVISKENRPAYCRPLISYYLEGKAVPERMGYREADFYQKNACNVLYGKSALSVDGEKKYVTLDSGETLPYTALCIAAGSSPIMLPIAGIEKVKKLFTFMTLDDATAIKEAVGKESRVLIIGAGLIGLKCAEGLCESVKSIAVCDLAARVLSSILDDECAALMQKKLEEHNASFMLGDTVEGFEENEALMRSGKKVGFDIVIMAVGVRPNTSAAKTAGAEVNRGIIVNDRMESTVRGIYAAGDCAEGMDISLGARRVLAILPNAYMQGYCAGVNMAGGEYVFDKGIPMNAIGFFGLHALSAGSYFTKEQGGEIYEERSEGKIRRLFTKDNRLCGFMFIGDTDKIGIYTSLIRDRVPLDTINFDLLKKSATFAAFSPEIRGKKFGGVV